MKKINIDAKTTAIVEAMLEEAESTVKLSKTSKLGVYSWSLQAINTCPAAIGVDGELVDACKGCYATSGFYHYSDAKAPREFNRLAWQQDNFVSDFIDELDHHRYFRWLDSGDLFSLPLAEKVYQIMAATPHVKHWLPTRMHKFPKFEKILSKMAALPNVAVRLSSDSIVGEKVDSNVSLLSSTIIHPSQIGDDSSLFVCRAYEQGGKCLKCRVCYNKDVQTVAYVAHGVSMKKQHRLIGMVEAV